MVEMAERLKIWQSQLQAVAKQEGGFEDVVGGGRGVRNVAQSELTNQLLGKISAMKGGIQEGDATSLGQGTMAYQLVYSKDSGREMKMAQVSELERRLATLEQVVTGKVAPEPTDFSLAFSSSSTSSPGASPYPSQGIASSLDDIRAKVSSLDEHAIDQLSHRMTKLTRQYETLKALRDASQSHIPIPSHSSDPSSNSIGPDAVSSSSSPSSSLSPAPTPSTLTIDNSKLDKLFHSITHLDTVASELPIVVERLVQLRALHEQAVHFSSQISSISSSQTEISSVLASNLAGITRMQDSLSNNMGTIEKNVLALEKRIADVSTLLSK
jgi:dynactin-2